MRIKEVKPSQRRKGRILVVLEDGTILRVTEEVVLDFGLRPGGELDEAQLAAVAAAARKSSAKADAARMVGSRALSKRELEQRLTRRGATGEEAREAADWLEDIGAVDDANYAQVVARHYGQRGYGPGRVRQELQRRVVPREHWDAALGELPDSRDTIRDFIQRKCRGDLSDPRELKRLSDALARRGFTWGEVRAVLSTMTTLEDTPED